MNDLPLNVKESTELKTESTVVISLGGSIINGGQIDCDFLQKFRELIISFITHNNRVFIVCGGGNPARVYINALSHIVSSIPDIQKDWMGISATRLNATLVRSLFEDEACKKVITNPTVKVTTDKKIIIGAGWKPGFSTDYDAVMLAYKNGASTVLNISNVAYVCDKDPNKFSDAKSFENLSWEKYISFIGKKWTPGLNAPFDPIASQFAQKKNIEVRILSGDLDNIKNCLYNKEWKGTTIKN